MLGKLGLVAGVAFAWLLAFVLMGGKVMPAIGGDHDQPQAVSTSTPLKPMYPTATPIGPSSNRPTANGAAPAAQKAESLAQQVTLFGRMLVARPAPRRSGPPIAEFRIATFNALGSSHTVDGGRGRAPGPTRMERAAQYVLGNGFSLVGFQEMQQNQRATFMAATGGQFGLYPGDELRSQDGENSIAWRTDTWDVLAKETVPIPYFGGQLRYMPILTLRNKATGITITMANFHNPADTQEYGNQAKWRAQAKQREIEILPQLRARGLPLFVTGDMNERQSWFCAVAGPADLRAAAGGDARHGCTVTGSGIDWIAASYDVGFTDYHADHSPFVQWVTDHPIVWADATVDSRAFPRALNPRIAGTP